jgi:hypothetical protein
MAQTVRLKGFDHKFQLAIKNLDIIEATLVQNEANKAKTWTAAQTQDLVVLYNAIAYLFDAVSEMAARVRDD